MIFTRDPDGGNGGGRDDQQTADIYRRGPAPLPPLRFSIEDNQTGVRITVINDGPGGRQNGAVRYDPYWTETVDTTTTAGKAAGFARGVCLSPPISATNVDNSASIGFYADPKYAAGYFYLCGVDKNGVRSEPSEPARVVTGPVDTTIPDDFQHLQISESGIAQNGTVDSELSVTAVPPANTRNVGGMQLYLGDYLAIGNIQEGCFHKWSGSGGINFTVSYPIARRRSSISVTATTGSANVTAAGGLLGVAKSGEIFELMGAMPDIVTVSDTQIVLSGPWAKTTVTTSDYVIIGKPRIYGVAVSKAGTRRGDIENAPYVDVLMDGNLSAPNAPATIYLTRIGAGVRLSWDQVQGSTIRGYNVYRSSGASADAGMAFSPPRPTAGTIQIDKIAQNPNLLAGSSQALPQSDDTKFTPYELENNSQFTWYVTTTNTRGDESAATSLTGYCRQNAITEIDPTVPARSPNKNYHYDAVLYGTSVGDIAANDTAQDAYLGTDASNLPGRPYGSASGQVNGTGKYRGYTRWESSKAGTAAAGNCLFANGNEARIDAPGASKTWNLYQENGAWEETSGSAFMKMEQGGVYTVSLHVNHAGVTPDGLLYVYVDQYNNGTLVGHAKRIVRDSTSVLTTDTLPLSITTSEITANVARYQAAFLLDSTLTPTKQIRVTISRQNGTAGVVVVTKDMFNAGDVAGQWTADMGDTTISIPVPGTPTPPMGDGTSDTGGGGKRHFPEPIP